ncbi:MAG: hypothetical protein ACJAZY_003739 [Spirosomataceae bacterium]|jgi:uncharacterized protein (DUF433 family)
MDYLSRITIDPEVMSGQPTIRKMHFTVVQMPELLASGMTTEEILTDYPYLEKGDIVACLQYGQEN